MVIVDASYYVCKQYLPRHYWKKEPPTQMNILRNARLISVTGGPVEDDYWKYLTVGEMYFGGDSLSEHPIDPALDVAGAARLLRVPSGHVTPEK